MKNLRRQIVVFVVICVMGIVSLGTCKVIANASEVSNTQGSYENPTIEIESVTAKVGEYVEIDLTIYNNPGITAMGFNVYYDTDLLTWNGVIYGDKLSGYTIQPQKYTSGTMLNWLKGLENLEDSEFIYATLYFVANDEVESTDINITYDSNDIFNLQEENITFDVVVGEVVIQNTTAESGATAGDASNAESSSVVGDSSNTESSATVGDSSNMGSSVIMENTSDIEESTSSESLSEEEDVPSEEEIPEEVLVIEETVNEAEISDIEDGLEEEDNVDIEDVSSEVSGTQSYRVILGVGILVIMVGLGFLLYKKKKSTV